MWKKSISQSRVSFGLTIYMVVFSSTTVQPQRYIGLAPWVGKEPHKEVAFLQNVKRPQLASTCTFLQKFPLAPITPTRPNPDASKPGERGARSD